MSIVKSAIKNLLNAANENRSKDEIEKFKNVISENIEESLKSSEFYYIPFEILLDIIGKTKFTNCKDCLIVMETLISNLSHFYPKHAAQLLHYFSSEDVDELSFHQCANVFGFFTTSPLCVKFRTLYDEFTSLPERDYEYEIQQKDLMILKIQKEI